MSSVVAIYAGFLCALVGGASLLHPLRPLGIRTRLQGALALIVGLLAAVVGLNLPVGESHIDGIRSSLDRFAPAYQFAEVHRIHVSAPKDAVWAAIKTVGPEEILLFRTLTAWRRFGRPGPESILNAPRRRPILDTATRTGFIVLAEDPGREIVIGAAMWLPVGSGLRVGLGPNQFKDLNRPGIAKVAMNFLVEDGPGGGCSVVTETRVYATDATAQARFARYWRAIRPGSGLIRWMWLRAIKLRAEAVGK